MKNNLVKIIKVRKCFFSSKNRILIQALDDCETRVSTVDDYGNFLYRTIYRIQKNHMQWIEVPKTFVFSKNQIVNFSIVCNKFTWEQFPDYIT